MSERDTRNPAAGDASDGPELNRSGATADPTNAALGNDAEGDAAGGERSSQLDGDGSDDILRSATPEEIERARRIAAALAAAERGGTSDVRRTRRTPLPMTPARGVMLTAAACLGAVGTTAVVLRGVPDESPLDAVIAGGILSAIGVGLTWWLIQRIGDDPSKTPFAWMAATAIRLFAAILVPVGLIFGLGAAPVSSLIGALAAALACLVLDVWIIRRQVMGRAAAASATPKATATASAPDSPDGNGRGEPTTD
ncbi:MAG: hypothetical protein ACOC0P_01345 [Planctomycetota bacterium]